MEGEDNLSLVQKNIKSYLTALIVIASVGVLLNLKDILGLILVSKAQDINNINMTNADMEVHAKFQLVKSIVELILGVLVILGSVYILKNNEEWRKRMLYILGAGIIYLMLIPLLEVSYFPIPEGFAKELSDKEMLSLAKYGMLAWSYFWSILISVYFYIVIRKLNRAETKALFLKTT